MNKNRTKNGRGAGPRPSVRSDLAGCRVEEQTGIDDRRSRTGEGDRQRIESTESARTSVTILDGDHEVGRVRRRDGDRAAAR